MGTGTDLTIILGGDRYPASYYTGPLGAFNILPPAGKAFLIEFYGGYGVSWAQVKTAIAQRETDMGRMFDGIHIHYGTSGAGEGLPSVAFTEDREQWVHDRGQHVCVTFSPSYTIAQVNAGTADAHFAEAIDTFKAYNFPIMWRLFHEFDQTGISYSASPSDWGANFISAWQRVVDMAASRGADNIGFWWCPTEGLTPDRSLVHASYPGDAYVDWVGSDNYCFFKHGSGSYSSPLHSGWAELWELFNYFPGTNQNYHDIWGPHKPFVIGETGCVYDDGVGYEDDKGAWFEAIPAAIADMQYLTGISFYDQDVSFVEGADANFRVDHSTSVAAIYAGWQAMCGSSVWNGG